MASTNTMASVPTKHKCDFGFAKKSPYGLLMTGQVVAGLMIILILSFAPFRYEGTSFLFTTALSATIGIGIVLLGQMTGLHRRIFELSNGFILIIPLCFLYFAFSFVFFFCFVFNTMMCIISLLDSLRFTIGMMVSYGLLTCFSAGMCLACFHACILLFRAAPNGQVLNLVTVIIEGDKTVRTPGSVPQFSPVTSPTGRSNVV